MTVTQLSITVENRAGRLLKLTRLLADEGVNIRALNIVGSSDFSVIRLVPDYPEAARGVLRQAGYASVSTELVAVCLDDRPGSLSELLSALVPAEIHVEYSYSLLEKVHGRAVLLLRASDPDGAMRVLGEHGFHLLSHDDVARGTE